MPDYEKELEQFEKEWAEKIAQENKDLEDEEEETVEDEETTEDDEETTEDDSEDTETDEEEIEPTGDEDFEPVKKDKKDKDPSEKAAYSFKKLREEAKLEKEKSTKLEQELRELEGMATSLGYANVSEFKQAIEEQRIKKEAERTNRDPEVVKELSEQRKRLDALEAEKKALIRKTQEDEVVKQLGEFIAENGLNEAEFSQVLEEAANDGFQTLDDFVGVKGVKKYLKGVASDIIITKTKQKELEKEKKKEKLSGDKHTKQTTPQTKKSIQEIAEEEVLKEYGVRKN